MIPINPATVAAVALVFIGLRVNASTVDYNNPVRSAQEDLVKSSGIFNESSEFKFFAGYLKAFRDGEPEQFLYYWFIESASDPLRDPVVLRLHGGPGASSLRFACAETGPIRVEDGKVSSVDHKLSWNKLANMLYIEGPVGVGNSYSKVIMNSTDDSTARANHLALKSFMQKFPHLAGNPLYLTGISYAGVYLPTLGVRVDEDPELNLKGIAIENGMFDDNLRDGSMALKLYYYGLIGDRQLAQISDACCKGAPPTRENCDFDGLYWNKECRFTVDQMYLGFIPSDSGLNLYNVYNKKPDLTLDGFKELNPTSSRLLDSQRAEHSSCHKWTADHLTPSSQQLKQLLHIPREVARVEKITYCKQYTFLPGGVAPYVRSLIDSKRNLTMLIYNGDTDFICNFLGTRWFVQSLDQEEMTDYEPWKFNGQIAGFVQQFDGLTFATVLGAGHNPSKDIPDVSYVMFKQFLHSKGSKNVNLKHIE